MMMHRNGDATIDPYLMKQIRCMGGGWRTCHRAHRPNALCSMCILSFMGPNPSSNLTPLIFLINIDTYDEALSLWIISKPFRHIKTDCWGGAPM